MRDGIDESGQLVGKYCGKIAPSPVVSSGNQLFIKFVSDYETHGAGFSIRYEIFKSGKSDIIQTNRPHLVFCLSGMTLGLCRYLDSLQTHWVHFKLYYLALYCDILEEFVPSLLIYQWVSHSGEDVRSI